MIVTPFAQVSLVVKFANKRKSQSLVSEREPKKTSLNKVQMVRGFAGVLEQPLSIMSGPATGSGIPLALAGSYVGRASRVCSLYTLREAANPIRAGPRRLNSHAAADKAAAWVRPEHRILCGLFSAS